MAQKSRSDRFQDSKPAPKKVLHFILHYLICRRIAVRQEKYPDMAGYCNNWRYFNILRPNKPSYVRTMAHRQSNTDRK